MPHEERVRRRQTIAALIAAGASPEQLREQVRRAFGIGPKSTERYATEVRAAMAAQAALDQPYLKQMHRRRLLGYIQRLQGHVLRGRDGEPQRDAMGNPIVDPRAWPSIMRAEHLLGEVDGTFAPIEIDHAGTIGVRVAGAIASLSAQDAAKILSEQREMARKAALADRLVVESPPLLRAVQDEPA